MSDEPPGARPRPPGRRGGPAPPRNAARPAPRPGPPPVLRPALPLVFLSSPPGRAPSIRWRPAAVLAPAAGLTLLFAFLSKPAMVGGDALGLRGPGWTRSVTWWDGAGGGAGALFTLALLAGVAGVT